VRVVVEVVVKGLLGGFASRGVACSSVKRWSTCSIPGWLPATATSEVVLSAVRCFLTLLDVSFLQFFNCCLELLKGLFGFWMGVLVWMNLPSNLSLVLVSFIFVHFLESKNDIVEWSL
jgi:hypothetical protein